MNERSVDREDSELVSGIRNDRPHARVGDFGCGPHKLNGAIGVDVMPHRGTVDLVCDLDATPWPFAENSFDVVRCNHLDEHVDDVVGFIEMIYRALAPGGYLVVRTPHYWNVDSFAHPTH